jgi:hypothetical protein
MVAWLSPVVASTPSTPGFQALIVPSSVAKIKTAAPDLLFSGFVKVKSVAFRLMLPTTPVGVPALPAALVRAAGIVTNR